MQEGATSLRHELSSNDLNNNDNEYDESEAELGDRIVNLSNGYSESSMSGTYQEQNRKKQVGFHFSLTSNCHFNESLKYIN